MVSDWWIEKNLWYCFVYQIDFLFWRFHKLNRTLTVRLTEKWTFFQQQTNIQMFSVCFVRFCNISPISFDLVSWNYWLKMAKLRDSDGNFIIFFSLFLLNGIFKRSNNFVLQKSVWKMVYSSKCWKLLSMPFYICVVFIQKQYSASRKCTKPPSVNRYLSRWTITSVPY